MITSILKFIVQIAVRIFFRKVEVTNFDALPKKGPMIIAANHPNTFMDASIVNSFLHQKPKFLAKSTVFNPGIVKWLLTSMGGIPVQRAVDSPDGKADTSFLFAKCFETLAEGNTILIFPEGVSHHGRHLHKIKTGAARIALGAEAENNFELGIQIVTMGINYSNPRNFRSDLYLNIANPIQVKDWKAAYEADEQAAAKDLTEKIRSQLEAQLIVTQDAEEDNLLGQIEEVYKGRLLEKFGWCPNDAEQNFKASKGLESALRYYKETDANRVAMLKNKLTCYFHNLNQLKLNDDLFEDKSERPSFFVAGLKQLMYLILGFPLWLYGLINNYIPYRLPSKIAYMISHHEEYIAPIMMFVGVPVFSLFYGMQIWGVHHFVGIPVLTFVYALTLPLVGFFTLAYWRNFINTRDQWNLFSKFYKKGTLVADLIRQREAIVKEMDKAKEEYLVIWEAENT